MSTDGGLKDQYKSHLKDIDWQPVETWGTGQGVPDCNFCGDGVEGWIENKCITSGNKFSYQTEQVGWIERRRRHGGRVFVGVRVNTPAGPRRGPARDEFWLFSGDAFRWLVLNGLPPIEGPAAALIMPVFRPLLVTRGGPARWAWSEIRRHLVDFDFLFLQNEGIKRNVIIKET